MARFYLLARTALVGMPVLMALACVPAEQISTILTPEELAAAAAAGQSGYSLAESAGVAEAVAASDVAQTKPVNGTVSVAGCPVLTLSPAGAANTFNISLDFDGGCPLPGQEIPVCIGSASGTIDFAANHAVLTLTALTCGDAPTLDGTMDVVYTQVDGAINLNGNWDLSFTSAGNQTRITGPGDITFDPATQTATVNQFQGQLTLNSDVWNVTMTGVQIPLVDNPSQLPSAGTIQLDGGFLRQFTIQFTDQSPSTGVVNVSFLGLFFFPVNLNELVLGAA